MNSTTINKLKADIRDQNFVRALLQGAIADLQRYDLQTVEEKLDHAMRQKDAILHDQLIADTMDGRR